MSSMRTPTPSNPTASPTQTGHSRRDHQSISSTHSSSGRSERGTRTGSASHPAVESAVTRLLVAIKQLLEALTLWSQLRMDETQVSDVYVRLGNDFNAAVAAFAAFNIDMTELMSVPDDLRNVLEQCLAEDATQENLELYLPTVRQIITSLLQGLRGKQSIYRRIVSDHRDRSSQQSIPGDNNRTSRSSRGHRSQTSRTVAESERPDSISRRSGEPSGRQKDPLSTTSISTNGNSKEPFVGGFAPSIAENVAMQDQGQTRRQKSLPSPIDAPRQPELAPPPQTSPPLPPPPTSPPLPPPPPQEVIPPPPSPPPSAVPAHVKRYSLSDKPMTPPPPPPPSVVVEEPSSPGHERNGSSPPTPETPPLDGLQAPAMANSLAALKKSDALERRASKRFSTYNISKMTGGSTTRERSLRGHPNRRSLAVSSALTPGELAVLTEVDDEEEASSATLRLEASSRSVSRSRSRPETPEQKHTPPVPPLPSTPARSREPTPPPSDPVPPVLEKPTSKPSSEKSRERSSDSRFTVFLQLGREVKKVMIEPGLSFSSLRVLFVDKFSYNPGLENFPAIYIRDPSSGVQYELEDMEEVQEKCLLSLNIEPLDQIKQHIDTQISTLSRDIKELKTTITTTNRHSVHTPNIITHPLAESTPAPNRPTDRQFQHVARRLSRFVGDPVSPQSASAPPPVPPMPQIQPQMTGQSLQPQMTGGSMLSDYSSRVVTDLKTQFDEVQNLRRDLGIMRQLYTEFMKQTKESLGTLRGQTQSVKQLAHANVGGARGYIDSGKKKLDIRSQNVLTEVEKLQDTVEGVKDDVLKRHVTPKAQYFKSIKKDIDSVASELESLKEHIKTIKPMWKKTWEEELQNIVEEQQFLNHQEEFLSDLLEDHKAVVEVYGHVEKVITLRGATGGPSRVPRNRGFRPPPPEEGHNGLSTVMLEIRGAAVDPEKRMKAIEANQKNREKELASRADDLQAELTDFVGGKKLKMTGGAEEAERVRQRRNEMTLKAMFNGSGTTTSGSPSTISTDLPSSSPSP